MSTPLPSPKTQTDERSREKRKKYRTKSRDVSNSKPKELKDAKLPPEVLSELNKTKGKTQMKVTERKETKTYVTEIDDDQDREAELAKYRAQGAKIITDADGNQTVELQEERQETEGQVPARFTKQPTLLEPVAAKITDTLEKNSNSTSSESTKPSDSPSESDNSIVSGSQDSSETEAVQSSAKSEADDKGSSSTGSSIQSDVSSSSSAETQKAVETVSTDGRKKKKKKHRTKSRDVSKSKPKELKDAQLPPEVFSELNKIKGKTRMKVTERKEIKTYITEIDDDQDREAELAKYIAQGAKIITDADGNQTIELQEERQETEGQTPAQVAKEPIIPEPLPAQASEPAYEVKEILTNEPLVVKPVPLVVEPVPTPEVIVHKEEPAEVAAVVEPKDLSVVFFDPTKNPETAEIPQPVLLSSDEPQVQEPALLVVEPVPTPANLVAENSTAVSSDDVKSEYSDLTEPQKEVETVTTTTTTETASVATPEVIVQKEEPAEVAAVVEPKDLVVIFFDPTKNPETAEIPEPVPLSSDELQVEESEPRAVALAPTPANLVADNSTAVSSDDINSEDSDLTEPQKEVETVTTTTTTEKTSEATPEAISPKEEPAKLKAVAEPKDLPVVFFDPTKKPETVETPEPVPVEEPQVEVPAPQVVEPVLTTAEVASSGGPVSPPQVFAEDVYSEGSDLDIYGVEEPAPQVLAPAPVYADASRPPPLIADELRSEKSSPEVYVVEDNEVFISPPVSPMEESHVTTVLPPAPILDSSRRSVSPAQVYAEDDYSQSSDSDPFERQTFATVGKIVSPPAPSPVSPPQVFAEDVYSQGSDPELVPTPADQVSSSWTTVRPDELWSEKSTPEVYAEDAYEPIITPPLYPIEQRYSTTSLSPAPVPYSSGGIVSQPEVFAEDVYSQGSDPEFLPTPADQIFDSSTTVRTDELRSELSDEPVELRAIVEPEDLPLVFFEPTKNPEQVETPEAVYAEESQVEVPSPKFVDIMPIPAPEVAFSPPPLIAEELRSEESTPEVYVEEDYEPIISPPVSLNEESYAATVPPPEPIPYISGGPVSPSRVFAEDVYSQGSDLNPYEGQTFASVGKVMAPQIPPRYGIEKQQLLFIHSETIETHSRSKSKSARSRSSKSRSPPKAKSPRGGAKRPKSKGSK